MSSLAVSRSSLRCYSLGRPPAGRHSLWEEPYGEIGPLPTKRWVCYYFFIWFSLVYYLRVLGFSALDAFPRFLFAPKWGLRFGKREKKYQPID